MEIKIVKYSEAFKIQVVRELESGKLSSKGEARRKYGIGGKTTVGKWVRKYGKRKETVRVVRVELPDERKEIERLREENRKLKAALADTVIENMIHKSYFEISCEDQGIQDIEAYKKKLESEVTKKLKD